MHPDLNFPKAELRLGNAKGQVTVFDIIRKAHVILTPEEWVRQHVVHFLIHAKGYPKGLVEVEKNIKLFNTEKRVDILVRTVGLKPLLLVECKAPHIKLTQAEANQIGRYQLALEASYCMLTNGSQHFVMKLSGGKLCAVPDLPSYAEAIAQPLE